jgi:hypothetical protein
MLRQLLLMMCQCAMIILLQGRGYGRQGRPPMKRHAPGGYEPHGPPQHQVRSHMCWGMQTSPMRCLV